MALVVDKLVVVVLVGVVVAIKNTQYKNKYNKIFLHVWADKNSSINNNWHMKYCKICNGM